MHKLGLINGGWTGALRTIVLLFHAIVANLRVRRVRAIKAVQRFAVLLLRLVRDRIDLVLLIDCGWDLPCFALVGEVRLVALSHTDRVVLVVSVSRSHEAFEATKAWLDVDVLVRHISNDLDGAQSLSETLVLLYRVLN